MSKKDDSISPKTDCVFKAIFGDKKNVDILTDFLSSAIDLPASEFLKITYSDKELTKDNVRDKRSVLDVRVSTAAGTEVNIEIQVNSLKSMARRSVYYWSKLNSAQLVEGDRYDQLNKVIAINILDYNMFDFEKYHSTFMLYEREMRLLLTDCERIDFLELKKAMKSQKAGDDDKLLKWMQFLNTRSNEKEALEMLEQSGEPMKKAVAVLKHLSEDEQMRRQALAREKWIRDEASLRGEGLEEGLEEGLKEGFEKGEASAARKMLAKGFSLDTVADTLDIPLEKIKLLIMQ